MFFRSLRTKDDEKKKNPTNKNSLAVSLTALAPLAATLPALAAGPGGDNHLLTGQLVSLLHPAIMFFLFGATGYTGWLGLRWRRTREIPDLVKALKAQLPKAAPAAEGAAPPPPRPPSPLDGQIAELEAERKALIASGARDKHFNWGSLLLALGVLIAVEGPANTYLRTGKLFPGPHLYAGAGIVVLWAAAAALVPQMQKGSDTARSLHIALNCVNLALFAWQVPTGLEIVAKVFEFTTLP